MIPDALAEPDRLVRLAKLVADADPEGSNIAFLLGEALYRARNYQKAFDHFMKTASYWEPDPETG